MAWTALIGLLSIALGPFLAYSCDPSPLIRRHDPPTRTFSGRSSIDSPLKWFCFRLQLTWRLSCVQLSPSATAYPAGASYIYCQTAIPTGDFVQEYKNKKWIYARNAAATARICNEILQAERVPGVITQRVKDASSLERKLRERQTLRGRVYPTKERIHWEMADLAGVRIVVYLPQDHERVVHALSGRFDMELKKSYGAVDTTSVVRKLSWHIQRPGYCATHCWVFLKEDEPQARDGQTRRRVEIQVVTMLRHAWAQFEHDAVYKAQSAMNLEDRQIVDSLSCAIDRGEWILNCIPDSGVRNMSSDLLFEMVYEVGCLVAEIAREESRAQGTAKPLLEFLRHLKEAKPKGLCGLMVKERL